MSDRLAELRRQRALVQEHLAWLDREIAATAGDVAEPKTVLPASTPTRAVQPQLQTPNPKLQTSAALATVPAASALPAVPGESLLDQYRIEPTALRADVRKGCFLYFAAALVLFIVVVGILYVTLSSR